MKNIRELFDYFASLKESDLQPFLDEFPKTEDKQMFDVVLHDHEGDIWTLTVSYELDSNDYKISELMFQTVEHENPEFGTKSEKYEASQIFPIIEYPYGEDDDMPWSEFYSMKL